MNTAIARSELVCGIGSFEGVSDNGRMRKALGCWRTAPSPHSEPMRVLILVPHV